VRVLAILPGSSAESVRTTRAAIAELESPSAINSSTSRSRSRQLVQRVVAASPAYELRDHGGVKRRAALRDPLDCRDEVREVVGPVLQQVADSFSVFLQQLERVPLLRVLREDEHRRVRVLLADLLGGAQSFVGVRPASP